TASGAGRSRCSAPTRSSGRGRNTKGAVHAEIWNPSPFADCCPPRRQRPGGRRRAGAGEQRQQRDGGAGHRVPLPAPPLPPRSGHGRVGAATPPCVSGSLLLGIGGAHPPMGRVDFYAVVGAEQTFLEAADLREGGALLCPVLKCDFSETYDSITDSTRIGYC